MKKSNIESILAIIARQEGISVEDVKKEISLALECAGKSKEKNDNFVELFSTAIPRPEKAISILTDKIVKDELERQKKNHDFFKNVKNSHNFEYKK